MGKRGGFLPAAAGLLIAVSFSVGGLGLASGSTTLPEPPSGVPAGPGDRVVNVLALADPRLSKNEIWKVDVARVLMEVSQDIRETAGIRFRITTFGYWDHPPDGSGSGSERVTRPLATRLAVLRSSFGRDRRGSCDIVIGLTPEDRGETVKGITDYLEGVVLIQYFAEKNRLPYVLLHELCHLFGAIDLSEEGSVMSRRQPRFRFDAFTTTIMRVNKERSFRAGECPLSEEAIIRAIALYRERQTRRPNEEMPGIFIKTLQAMLPGNNRTAAVAIDR